MTASRADRRNRDGQEPCPRGVRAAGRADHRRRRLWRVRPWRRARRDWRRFSPVSGRCARRARRARPPQARGDRVRRCDARRDLERIVHPAVQAAIDQWFAVDGAGRARDSRSPIIPLLYETGRERDFDVIVTTACGAEEQLRRVMTRDSLTEIQARQRIAAQLSTEEKVRRANHAIWTDGTLENTKRQVLEVLERLAAKR